MTSNSSIARKPLIKPKPPDLQGNIVDSPDQDYLQDSPDQDYLQNNLLDEDEDDLAPPTFKIVDPPKLLRQRGTPDGSSRLVIAIDYGTTFTGKRYRLVTIDFS